MAGRGLADGARPSGRGVWPPLLRAAWFLEPELALLGDLVGPGGVCLDVGAANGFYSVVMARVVGCTGVVHAVEPQPYSARVLDGARAVLGLRTVRTHRVALDDGHGESTLVVPTRRGRVHGRAYLADASTPAEPYPEEFRGAAALPVRTTTLDAFAAEVGLRRLDLVKVDVEGAELRVLRGGEATLAAHRPALVVEVEDRHTAKYGSSAADVFAWLSARGYRAGALRDGVLQPTRAPLAGSRNYVFQPG